MPPWGDYSCSTTLPYLPIPSLTWSFELRRVTVRSMRGPALVLGIVVLSSAAGLTYQATKSASEAANTQNTELQTAAANAEVLK